MSETLSLTRLGSEPSLPAPPEYFTGDVRIESRFKGTGEATISGATVIFAPGARTAWHTHPLGQTLIVTAGLGRVRVRGGEIQDIRPGDMVWIPAGVEHWHGAAPEHGMTHIAFSEAKDGQTVTWLNKVSDAEYGS